MTRTTRTVLFAIAGGAVAALAVLGVLRLPAFGSEHHPYRDHAVAAGVAHDTANLVSSVNFDQRGLDTLGEETILLASVIGVSVLLRPADDETEVEDRSGGRVLDSTKLGGYILLPVTVLIGLDVVAHGHLTPGGGFQGGVILGTAIHLLYVAGRYRSLERIRPIVPFEWGEAIGSAAFACMGLAAALVSGSFLANVISYKGFGQLYSSGVVAALNGAVGIEVASGVMVLLAKFLEQAIVLRRKAGSDG